MRFCQGRLSALLAITDKPFEARNWQFFRREHAFEFDRNRQNRRANTAPRFAGPREQILGADASGAGKLPNNAPARGPQERHRSLPPIHLTVQRSTLGLPKNTASGE
jgi:hypothetical protein